MKTTFIYALCEPGTRTVRYIGKADAPEKRLQRHLRYNSIRTETHLGRWLRSLVSGGMTPALVVLAEVSRGSWQEEEIRYIRAARVLGLGLTNGTDGGDGGLNPSPETLRHMRESHLGHTHTPEHREKISVSMRGKQNTLGKKASAETRAKMRAAHRGEKNHRFGKTGIPWSDARRAAQKK